MEDYQERVLVEQKELADKIIKLTAFITNREKTESLVESEWMYLCRQLEVMTEYNRILIMRITRFNKDDQL